MASLRYVGVSAQLSNLAAFVCILLARTFTLALVALVCIMQIQSFHSRSRCALLTPRRCLALSNVRAFGSAHRGVAAWMTEVARPTSFSNDLGFRPALELC